MDADRPERRLAAILSLDVVGYSRAMEDDEEGTIARLIETRSELIDPLIDEFGGRIFKSMGDGLFAEFKSSVEALRCAVEIQKRLTQRGGSDDGAPISVRIGVNLGDVLIRGDDVFGTGVNVAARLEAIAEPGGVCISGRVLEDVETTMDVSFDHLGSRTLKNIQRPIDVYAVRVGEPNGDPGIPVHGPPRRRGRVWVTAMAAAVAAILATAGAAWWIDELDTVSATKPAAETALPAGPSIVVLPFENLSEDPSQQYFAEGIAEDLTTDLSKVSGLFVIARNSAFASARGDASAEAIAAELGVRFVLQGSVRRADGQIRINARLIDAREGANIWAERYDGGEADVFDLQDAVTRQIVSVLEVRLTGRERQALDEPDTSVPEAHDLFLRGWSRYVRQTPDNLRAAIEDFEAAIRLDDDYGRAHAALAATHWQIARRWWWGEFGFLNYHRARAHAEALLESALRWETALAYQTSASVLSQKGHHDQALAQGARALALDPNDADSFVALAGAFSLSGEPERALELVEKAMRLNPRSPSGYFYERGLAEYGLGNYSLAAEALQKAIEANPDDRWSKRLLVAAYGQLGRVEEAQAIAAAESVSWQNSDPFTIGAVTYWYPYRNDADRRRLAEGLRKAGLPD